METATQLLRTRARLATENFDGMHRLYRARCTGARRAGWLRGECPGPPPRQLGSGGFRQQLEKLRRNIHPVSGSMLPAAMHADGTPVVQHHGDTRLKKAECEVIDPLFNPYVPMVLPIAAATPQEGSTAKEKEALRLIKVRFKERRDRIRREEAKKHRDANELIRSFIESIEPRDGTTEDEESELFWKQIGAGDSVVDTSERMNRINAKVEASNSRGPGWQHGTRISRRAILSRS